MFSRDVGSLQDAIQYFHSHPHLFEREDHSNGHMERVMAVLTQQNMEQLEKQFQLYPKGLELPTFIYLIKKLFIPDHEISKYFFVSDLIKFFQAIDINGDGHLEWSEFTEYIIDNIRVVEKPRYKDKAFEENEIISTAFSKISSEYKLAKIYDLHCHSMVRKIVYYGQQDTYYMIESLANCVRVFNRKFEQIDAIFLEPEPKEKQERRSATKMDKKKIKKSSITDFSIDQNSAVLGCIFEDALYFCNLAVKASSTSVNCEKSVSYKKYDRIQYLQQHRMWCITSKHGQMLLFTISYTSRILISFKLQKSLHPHQNSITQILQTSQPLCLATSSMDGSIKLYSNHLDKYYTFEHIPEQTCSIINENKKKGILGISYTSEFGSYILSFGFSNCLYLYSLDISMTKGYAGKYGEHSGTVLWGKFVKGYPNVVSFDDKMNMRIWDFRKFSTIQFINCEKMFINPSHLCLIPQLHQILISEKKLSQFRAPALQKKSRQLNQFHNIFSIKYSSYTNQLFLFTSNDVRIYNYYTGSLKRLFTKLYSSSCQTNITACQFGFKSRRFFVGDAGGFVREYCCETGDQLTLIGADEEVKYENKEIKQIMFIKQHAILICCSLDGRTMIYEKADDGTFTLVRDLRECHEELVTAAVSERYCLLATGGDNGQILVWSLQKYLLQAIIMVHSKPIGISFSPIHPIMVIATEDGYISFYHVKPYEGKQRYKCFAKVCIHPYDEIRLRRNQRLIASFFMSLMVNAYLPDQCHLTQPRNSTPLPNSTSSPNSSFSTPSFPPTAYLSNPLPAPHHLICAVGTRDGKLMTLNLTPILTEYGIEENHQMAVIKNCHRCEVLNLKTVISHERTRLGQTCSGFFRERENRDRDRDRDTSIVWYYDQFVHGLVDVSQGPVENVVISKQSSSIFCKSADKKLRVYSFKNQYNGAINFLTFKKIFWKIPQINFFKKLQAIQTTIYSIKLIQNKRFKPEEQKKIKVHLLLNEYLTNKEKEHYFNWLAAKVVAPPEPQKLGRLKGRKMDSSNYWNGGAGNSSNPNMGAVSECLTEQQFHSIYNKVKNSIQKSLEWSQLKTVRKGKVEIDTSIRDREKDDQFLNFDQIKIGTRQRKHRNNENCILSKLKKKKSSLRFDHFQLFGQRSQSPQKKSQSYKKDLLFTSLSTAKKVIMRNCNGTFYR